MFTPIIYKDANFHIYKIDENGNVKKNDEVLSNDDIIYHSTNGYDYILIEKLDGVLTMYPLDQVVYNSFYPDTQNIYEHFKCIHLDGNLRNNNLYNLDYISDVEEWRVVTYPGVEHNRYMISSFGNIIDTTNKSSKLLYIIKDYFQTVLSDKRLLPHRLVAYEFISHDVVNSGNFVNHIDNNGFNNCVINLEIVTNRENIKHAMMIGITKGTLHTDEIIETFCKLFIESGKNLELTKLKLAEHGLLQYFERRFIGQLMLKKRYKDITDKYFTIDDYKPRLKSRLTDNEVSNICDTIIQTKGCVSDAKKILHDNGMTRVTYNDIKSIRFKRAHKDISDKYFIIDKNSNFVKIQNK